ncbi:DUF6339 family protein [Streptomyces sp. I4(2020)]|uniref:DUF6339 family protein n=1 Tax=Streptomyces sp. I4(2020) TaxID=2760981 RepID=UPI0018EEB49A|nr:DUF6339 family protein [Streptomyces sp. I4(2020)]MBJ6613996.1 hypothetical protein [Streptomyces sp. I3(2020)]MBJ6630162.1 hypothetical protein [Streptomyces sp. I4(2020)]
MTLLYPRITPAEATALLEEYNLLSLQDLEKRAGVSPVAFYGTTGGHPADTAHLETLAHVLRDCAQRAGYPQRPDDHNKILFDRAAAKALHTTMDITPAEAGQPDMWTHLATCLVPDVVAWRFGTRTPRRWIGTGLIRHTLARLWWQAHVLAITDNGSTHYGLLDDLTESDLNQIFERRTIGGTPPLARALARELTAPRLYKAAVSRRDIVRDTTKRLRRLLPYTSFTSLDEAAVQRRVHTLVSQSIEALEARERRS